VIADGGLELFDAGAGAAGVRKQRHVGGGLYLLRGSAVPPTPMGRDGDRKVRPDGFALVTNNFA